MRGLLKDCENLEAPAPIRLPPTGEAIRAQTLPVEGFIGLLS